MAFANNLDPDEAQQYVGPYLRSKLFDTQIYISDFIFDRYKSLQILKENIFILQSSMFYHSPLSVALVICKYKLIRAPDKVYKMTFNQLCVISSPNPMFDNLLKSSR